MQTVVNKIPKKFNSVSDAIQWSIQSRTLQNMESAKVSIPPQLVQKALPPTGEVYWVWRNDLMASEKYWMSWFKGLTQIFLNITCPKLLLLAGNDRMDTDLTVAQMQGKFKMVCFP